MKTILLTILASLVMQVSAQIPLKYGAQRDGKRTDQAMQKWRDNRFGQFVTFGLFSIPGGHWQGKYYGGAAEWIKSSAEISDADYDGLRAKFNPKEFNATKWAKQAKEMGAKYALITTKFHDGFCLWPSKYTDFDVENTPYGKDLLKEFVDAYNKEGIDVIFYYSVLDWHHKDWRNDLKNEADSIAFKNYWEWMSCQIEELMTNYPTVKGFWYDGTWDKSVVKRGEYTYQLEQRMKAINPDIISGSRLRADETGARHFDANKKMMGDYEQGWERKLPATALANDWECVMTVPENQWGYHSDWRGYVKKPFDVIEMLVRCTALDGNFMINFGPNGQGSFRVEEQQMAAEVGAWMKKYSSAIYGCRDAGLESQNWGYYTAPHTEEGVVNMVVFNIPTSGQLRVKLDKGVKIAEAKFVGRDSKIEIDESVNGEFFLIIPKVLYSEPFVIRLKLQNQDGSNLYIAPLT